MNPGRFIARWSRRKREARGQDGEARSTEPAALEEIAHAAQRADRADPANPPAAPGSAPAADAGAAEAAAPLPAIESLTPESDYAPFMGPGVDPAVKDRALKALFSDPALYPMDGLDVYIDDYSRPDPLPEGWLERLSQLTSLHLPDDGVRPSSAPRDASSAPAPPAAEGARKASQDDPMEPDAG